MTPEQILSCTPRVLTQSQRESYFEHGYILVESLIPAQSVDELVDITDLFLKRSCEKSQSDVMFDLAPGHGPGTPRVRRLKVPDRDPGYWAFASGIIADVAADLLGPDVRFHHSKLNFKWHTGDDTNEVAWHQDIPFYPHTNYNVLAVGTYLTDTSEDDGPLMVIPGSHNGPLFELYDDNGNWTGALRQEDATTLETEKAVCLPGPKGSITVHHSRAVHGSRHSCGAGIRPLLINSYVAANAYPYADRQRDSENYRKQVRGKPATWAYHDPRPCPLPPDWSQGYTSIYDQQDAARNS